MKVNELARVAVVGASNKKIISFRENFKKK